MPKFKIDTFAMPGICARATRMGHFAIADGVINHGIVGLPVWLREGRPYNAKKVAIQRITDLAKAIMMPVDSTHSTALSAELSAAGATLSPKFGTICGQLEASK